MFCRALLLPEAWTVAFHEFEVLRASLALTNIKQRRKPSYVEEMATCSTRLWYLGSVCNIWVEVDLFHYMFFWGLCAARGPDDQIFIWIHLWFTSFFALLMEYFHPSALCLFPPVAHQARDQTLSRSMSWVKNSPNWLFFNLMYQRKFQIKHDKRLFMWGWKKPSPALLSVIVYSFGKPNTLATLQTKNDLFHGSSVQYMPWLRPHMIFPSLRELRSILKCYQEL